MRAAEEELSRLRREKEAQDAELARLKVQRPEEWHSCLAVT